MLRVCLTLMGVTFERLVRLVDTVDVKYTRFSNIASKNAIRDSNIFNGHQFYLMVDNEPQVRLQLRNEVGVQIIPSDVPRQNKRVYKYHQLADGRGEKEVMFPLASTTPEQRPGRFSKGGGWWRSYLVPQRGFFPPKDRAQAWRGRPDRMLHASPGLPD
ncbi:hypothetical protein G5I_09962 [Acromyrmex echinatior]|uniref:Uncharacterized protein n=1 Tax=Acromyrmex echinatior TaxID=103372 RepID=F4WVL8_ACREC|nr:hypothetical protein G5I_09962 [Acromyrmex echinatior]